MTQPKTGAAVIILVILAVVTSLARDTGWLPGLFLAAALAVVVWRTAYDMGYKDGRRDLIDPKRSLTEEQRTRLLMRSTMPRWRRWAGGAALAIPGLLFWIFIYAAIHYGGASGWAFLLATIIGLAFFGVGIWLMGLCWRPFREAQRRSNADRRSARELSAIDRVNEAQMVVHAYSHLVSESGTRLPDSALPYSKDVIRRSLLLWAALDRDAVARDRLCSMYGLLEDFLPHDDWLLLNEWDRLVKTKDVDALLKADDDFGKSAVRLMKETTARSAEGMDEFKRKLRQLDEG